MAWFKVDDQLAFNAKIVAAGNEAMGLWVRAGSWSAAQLTDGFVPLHMAMAMAGGMANAMASDMANGMAKICGADALVMAGLWDEVEGGYQFHDWSEFQPSAESEKEKRRKRSLAGQKGAEARWGGKSHGKSHSKSHGKAMANECEVDAPTRPDPTLDVLHTSSGFADAHPDAAELLEWFNAEVVRNGFKQPSATKGNRDAARLLLDRDGITAARAREVAEWALSNEFWRANIRSFSKLREKFETLEAQMQRPVRPAGGSFDQRANDTAMTVFGAVSDAQWALEG